jgi:hypothetical protein
MPTVRPDRGRRNAEPRDVRPWSRPFRPLRWTAPQVRRFAAESSSAENRMLRSTWRGLETWHGRDIVTLADERASQLGTQILTYTSAPVLDATWEGLGVRLPWATHLSALSERDRSGLSGNCCAPTCIGIDRCGGIDPRTGIDRCIWKPPRQCEKSAAARMARMKSKHPRR